jgi:hypothetical protein
LLEEFFEFVKEFDENDKASVCRMIAKMLRELARTDTTVFFQKWKDLKAFAWDTRFPGRRVPIYVVKLLQTREVRTLRKEIASLQRALLEVRHLSQIGDLPGPRIEKMENILEGVADGTLNEAVDVLALPIEVGTETESQFHDPTDTMSSH